MLIVPWFWPASAPPPSVNVTGTIVGDCPPISVLSTNCSVGRSINTSVSLNVTSNRGPVDSTKNVVTVTALAPSFAFSFA
jgi:hypothetical protein